MGKSIRAKIKKRLRTAKRGRIEAMIAKPQLEEHYESLKLVMDGRRTTYVKPKNAFRYPKEAGAVFPQHEVRKPIDYRAQNLPMAAFAFRGNRRKYAPEEQEMMKNIAENSHPKMEVMAGGGAILAQNGQRISLTEAERFATQVSQAEAGGNAAVRPTVTTPSAPSVPPAASSAISPEVSMGGEVQEEEEEPDNAADTSRRPVVKDTRRAKRTADARPRAGARKNDLGSKKKAHTPAPAKPVDTSASQDNAMAIDDDAKQTKKKLKKKASKATSGS